MPSEPSQNNYDSSIYVVSTILIVVTTVVLGIFLRSYPIILAAEGQILAASATAITLVWLLYQVKVVQGQLEVQHMQLIVIQAEAESNAIALKSQNLLNAITAVQWLDETYMKRLNILCISLLKLTTNYTDAEIKELSTRENGGLIEISRNPNIENLLQSSHSSAFMRGFAGEIELCLQEYFAARRQILQDQSQWLANTTPREIEKMTSIFKN